MDYKDNGDKGLMLVYNFASDGKTAQGLSYYSVPLCKMCVTLLHRHCIKTVSSVHFIDLDMPTLKIICIYSEDACEWE